jgi:peroxiredoxin
MQRLEAGASFPSLPGLAQVNAQNGRKAFVLYFFPKAFTGG